MKKSPAKDGICLSQHHEFCQELPKSQNLKLTEELLQLPHVIRRNVQPRSLKNWSQDKLGKLA